tara:strand:+ start:1263 stop:1475 length:213 start_codon:yes stop_codon:yes gene_type:complete
MANDVKLECWVNVYKGDNGATERDYFTHLEDAENFEEDGMIRRVHMKEHYDPFDAILAAWPVDSEEEDDV